MTPIISPCVASPVEQRALVHGYAYLQFLPGRDCIRKWLPANIRRTIEKPRDLGWEATLENLGITRRSGPGPIMSYRLSTLHKFRRKYSTRPLILCQTLFERVLPPNQLKRLRKARRPLANLVTENDDTLPLLYGPQPLPRPCFQLFDPPPHPLARLWSQRGAYANEASLSLREDGKIECQLCLFGHHRAPYRFDVNAQRRYDEYVYDFLTNLDLPAIVFGKTRGRIDWMIRDILRVLGPRFPNRVSQGQPLIQLVFDRQIRFQSRLPQGTLISMEPKNESADFRSCRLEYNRAHRWFTSQPIAQQETRIWQCHRLLFQRTPEGWRSQLRPFSDELIRASGP